MFLRTLKSAISGCKLSFKNYDEHFHAISIFERVSLTMVTVRDFNKFIIIYVVFLQSICTHIHKHFAHIAVSTIHPQPHTHTQNGCTIILKVIIKSCEQNWLVPSPRHDNANEIRQCTRETWAYAIWLWLEVTRNIHNKCMSFSIFARTNDNKILLCMKF